MSSLQWATPTNSPAFLPCDTERFFLGSGEHERQHMFLYADEKEQLFGGAKRGGKTFGLCEKAIVLSVLFPGNRGGLFRKTQADMRESTLVTFFQVCPRRLILDHHRTERRILIRTKGEPSVILYGGLGDREDIERAKGKEFGWFGIDEPSEIEEEVYLMLLAQLCWKTSDGRFPPYQALLCSNPEPGWVERRFRHLILKASNDRPVVSDGHRVFIRSLPRDNQFLPPGWEEEMRNNAPAGWVEKYLDGSWKVSEGQVFKEFDERVHVIRRLPADAMKRLVLVGSLDHATTGITCELIVGIDADGNLFAVGEYYQANRLISEHAVEILKLQAKLAKMCHKYDYTLHDPSMADRVIQGDRRQTELRSIIDLYRDYGVNAVPAFNAITAGVERVKEFLHVNPRHIHPLFQERGSPKLFIVGEDCPNLVQEMTEWKQEFTDNGSIQYIGADHALDNLRYIVMSRPRPAPLTPQDELSMTTHDQIAHRSHEAWLKKFGGKDKEGRWF